MEYSSNWTCSKYVRGFSFLEFVVFLKVENNPANSQWTKLLAFLSKTFNDTSNLQLSCGFVAHKRTGLPKNTLIHFVHLLFGILEKTPEIYQLQLKQNATFHVWVFDKKMALLTGWIPGFSAYAKVLIVEAFTLNRIFRIVVHMCFCDTRYGQ